MRSTSFKIGEEWEALATNLSAQKRVGAVPIHGSLELTQSIRRSIWKKMGNEQRVPKNRAKRA